MEVEEIRYPEGVDMREVLDKLYTEKRQLEIDIKQQVAVLVDEFIKRCAISPYKIELEVKDWSFGDGSRFEPFCEVVSCTVFIRI